MNMLRTLLLLALLTIGGCGNQPPKIDPLPTIKEVPVPVACVDQVPERPRLEHDNLDASYPVDILYTAALKDKSVLELYTNKLEVQVKACAVIPKR